MEEIARMLGISEYEAKEALGIIADTDPDLEISDNITGFLEGTQQLTNRTFNHIMSLKDRILEVVQNYFRNPIDAE